MSSVVTVQVNQVGPTTSQGEARGHAVLIDRPQEKGGEDRGAMGGEHMLMGLGGCFSSNLLAAISAREAAIDNVTITVSGTVEKSPARFSKIHMTVSADYQDRALMKKLVTIAERSCIAANTLAGAVELSISLEESVTTA